MNKFFNLNVFDMNRNFDPSKDKYITARTIRTYKLINESEKEERIEKTRLVCKGFQDKREDLLTYSSTADKSIVYLMIMYALNKNFNVYKGDVKTAFLHADMEEGEDIFVELPDDIYNKFKDKLNGKRILRLLKAMYGLKDAPRQFNKYLKKRLESMGWTEIYESVFIYKNNDIVDGIITTHVDDLLLLCSSD